MTKDWILLNPPKPKDENMYDLILRNEAIIRNVEYWSFGGGFEPLEKEHKGQLVKYTEMDVIMFREANNEQTTI